MKITYRRKGVALIESDEGILLVRSKREFTFPGGGAQPNESRKNATIRELREETGLEAIETKYLFSYRGSVRQQNSEKIQNDVRLFYVRAKGTPQPCNEIQEIHWWSPQSRVKLSQTTQLAIERYLKEYKAQALQNL